MGNRFTLRSKPTGTCEGREEARDAVLPGATAKVTGPRALELVADANGHIASRVAHGLYALKYAHGFKPSWDGLGVEVGRTFDVDLRLEVGAVAETVVVSGESPLIDTSESAVTVNYNQEMIQSTPVLRFSVFDYFQMTPGIASTQVQDSTTSSAFGRHERKSVPIDGTTSPRPAGRFWPIQTRHRRRDGCGRCCASAEYGNIMARVQYRHQDRRKR